MSCNCEGKTYNISLGCCTPVLGPVENYYTKSQVDKLIEDINVSGVTEEELDEKILSAKTEIENEIPTIPTSNTAFTNDAGYLTQHQSLEGYATEEYVNSQISSQTADFVSGEELSSYTYDKSTIDSKIAQGSSFDPSLYYDKTATDALLADKLDASAYTPTDLSNYYNKTEVDNKIASAKSEVEGEIPSLSGYATEQWVLDKNYISGVDLSNYATKQEIPTVPSNVSAFVNDVPYLTEHQSLDGYATEQWVEDKHYITGVDLSNYATLQDIPTSNTAFTNDAGYLTEHQSLEDYATTAYVNTQISSQTSDFVSGEELSSFTYDKSTIDSKIAQGGSFDPSLYYNKTATDALLADKLDASAYTPTDLSNYYTKNQVDTALDGKASAKALSDEARSREAVDDILYENVNTKLPTSAFTAYSASTKNVLDNKLDATAYTPTDLSNYYNKTEVDNKVSQSTSGLQQTLSAGTNIQISNNVISATDTTYSAGDGIQISGNTISTTTKFQCLTEQEWASVSGNPDTNTVYFIR